VDAQLYSTMLQNGWGALDNSGVLNVLEWMANTSIEEQAVDALKPRS
jgi:hypothetical protein